MDVLQKRTVNTYRNHALVAKDEIEEDLKVRFVDGTCELTKEEINTYHKLAVSCARLSKEYTKLMGLIINNREDWTNIASAIIETWSGTKKPMDIKPHDAVR